MERKLTGAGESKREAAITGPLARRGVRLERFCPDLSQSQINQVLAREGDLLRQRSGELYQGTEAIADPTNSTSR